MSIRREIEVTRKGLPRPIDVTFGTNMLPLEFVITDFELPEGAKLEVYAIGVSKKLVKQSCEVSGNVVSFTPEIGLFEEGKNMLQLAANHDGKDLFSFYIPVICQKTMFYEGAQDLEEAPAFLGMVMQMKQDVSKLSEQIANLKEAGTGATEEQISQIETNRNDIADLEISKVEQADLEAEVENQLDGAKADIVTELLAQIGGMPVFGTVDDNNKITITSTLAGGDYVLMYEGADGTIAEIGTITVENGEVEEPITGYVNQIPLSVASDGSDYVGANGEDGYKVGYRINSSGAEVAQSGMCCTGFIPYTLGQVIRLTNITPSGASTAYLVEYTSNKVYKQVTALTTTLADNGDGIYTGSIDSLNGFIRISCGVIDNTSILTLDQEIV